MARLLAKALRTGDTLGIIAPASPSRSQDRIDKSVQYFERMGYQVELGKHLMEGPGYLAAPDKDRLSDLHGMFRNKHVKAIFFLRGGYGSIRLLDRIDYDLIKTNPKIIVGYSDATALFNAIYKMTGLASCFFGPMPGVDMWDTFDPFAEGCMWRSLTSTAPFGELPLVETEATVVRSAGTEAVGRMLGGNLTVFNSLLGTPYQARLSNPIAFFEEIDEKPRKVDAYLAQLKLAGLWEKSRAVLLGDFGGCDEDPDSATLHLDEIFQHYFGTLKVPVLRNLPWGHIPRQWTIPLGARMRVRANAKSRSIAITEAVLS